MAAAIRTDPDHDRCVTFFKHVREPLVVPQLVITEVAYLVGRLLGPNAEASFLRALIDGPMTFPPAEPADLRRAADLIDTYSDLHLGTVDETLQRSRAERLEVTRIATLDHRHFAVVRPAHADYFEILP